MSAAIALILISVLPACHSNTGGESGPELVLPGADGGGGLLFLENDRSTTVTEVDLGSIRLCVDEPGSVIIEDVSFRGGNSVSVVKFATAREDAVPEGTWHSPDSLGDAGWTIDGDQSVDTLCGESDALDSSEELTWLGMELEASPSDSTVRRGLGIDISYRSGDEIRVLPVKMYFVFCETEGDCMEWREREEHPFG